MIEVAPDRASSASAPPPAMVDVGRDRRLERLTLRRRPTRSSRQITRPARRDRLWPSVPLGVLLDRERGTLRARMRVSAAAAPPCRRARLPAAEAAGRGLSVAGSLPIAVARIVVRRRPAAASAVSAAGAAGSVRGLVAQAATRATAIIADRRRPGTMPTKALRRSARTAAAVAATTSMPRALAAVRRHRGGAGRRHASAGARRRAAARVAPVPLALPRRERTAGSRGALDGRRDRARARRRIGRSTARRRRVGRPPQAGRHEDGVGRGRRCGRDRRADCVRRRRRRAGLGRARASAGSRRRRLRSGSAAAACGGGSAASAGRLPRFHLGVAIAVFERQALEIDIRLGERRLQAAQLADQRVARTLVDAPCAFGRSFGQPASARASSG